MQVLLILFVFWCAFCGGACGGSLRVEWPTQCAPSQAERTALEARLYETVEDLDVELTNFVSGTARFDEDMLATQTNERNVVIRLWSRDVPAGRYIDLGFSSLMADGIRYYWNAGMEYRDAPDTDAPVHSTAGQAMDRALEIGTLIGGVDLNDSSKWRMRSKGFIRKDWEFQWCPVVNGYAAPGRVSVKLADDQDLTLISFSHNAGVTNVVDTTVTISQENARQLADGYLQQYYRTNEVNTLTFSTNLLEILVPNYAFTTNDTGYEGWRYPTNPPVLVWRTIYVRQTNALYQAPVQIWVHAGDGSMCGGWE